MCDDKCPRCNKAFSPYKSVDLKSLPHTPTPWTAIVKNIVAEGRTIASTCNLATGEGKGMELDAKIVFDRTNKANAKRIVHCVNTYDELVEVCEKALKFLTGEEPSPLEVEGFQIDLEYTLNKAKNYKYNDETPSHCKQCKAYCELSPSGLCGKCRDSQ